MSQGAAVYTLYTAGVCSANNSTSGLPLFSSLSRHAEGSNRTLLQVGCKQKANYSVQWRHRRICLDEVTEECAGVIFTLCLPATAYPALREAFAPDPDLSVGVRSSLWLMTGPTERQTTNTDILEFTVNLDANLKTLEIHTTQKQY